MIISEIKNKIYTIRGVQVMLDSDLAGLYEIPVKALNQAVKRNLERFPKDFMFQIKESELQILRSQFVTSDKGWNKVRYFPYVFTEQGAAALSGILKSKKAAAVNVSIMRAFVAMRKFISQTASIFNRLDRVELRQIKHDNKFEEVFKALESHEKKQGIFYEGEVFDAYEFVCNLIKGAKEEIVLIDNYPDESVLTLFSKRKRNVSVIIYTKRISKQLMLDVEKFNSQYAQIIVKEFNNSHDRFMIIDSKEVYHFGASLKDLGKKWFAFSRFEKEAVEMLRRLRLNII